MREDRAILPESCDLGTRETAPRPVEVPQINFRDADFTDEVAAATQPIWEKIHGLLTPEDWILKAPLVHRINQLKKEQHAVILAHNYQSPEIFLGVADFVGDSLELARRAAEMKAEDAPVVVMCGVHFMAETVKVLAPDRKVLIPDLDAGCSLAESITGEDVKKLREKHPGVPVVVYVNTSAEVKAESDATCTSSNAVHVVEAIAKEFNTDTVLFLPDRFLAMNVAARTKVKIISWEGECIVHERFSPDEIRSLRTRFPGARVLAHPECPPEVLQEADYVGSTSGMISDVRTSGAKKVVMITECSMADNVASANPEVDFLRPCVLCPHMQRITLPKILQSLETLTPTVEVDPALGERAKKAVDKMLDISKGVKPGTWQKVA
jgi:quinolinate synthase